MKQFASLLLTLVVVALSACPAYSAMVTLVIDDLMVAQGQPTTTNRGIATGPDILGGERDLILGQFASGQEIIIGDGFATFQATSVIDAGTFILEWDGVQGDPGWPDGAMELPTTDLTLGGLNSVLAFNIIEVIGSWNITLSVDTIAEIGYQSYDWSKTPETGLMSFNLWEAPAYVDMTQVKGISLRMHNESAGARIQFGGVSVIPEPSVGTASILALGMGIMGRRRYTRR